MTTEWAQDRYGRKEKGPKPRRKLGAGSWIQWVFTLNVVITLIIFLMTLFYLLVYRLFGLVSAIASGWGLITAIALWQLASDYYKELRVR